MQLNGINQWPKSLSFLKQIFLFFFSCKLLSNLARSILTRRLLLPQLPILFIIYSLVVTNVGKLNITICHCNKWVALSSKQKLEKHHSISFLVSPYSGYPLHYNSALQRGSSNKWKNVNTNKNVQMTMKRC